MSSQTLSASASDSTGRALELESQNARLRELVQHCALHAADVDCGYARMPADLRALYDEVTGRYVVRRHLRSVPTGSAPWRHCDYCGRGSRADERNCCAPGRAADRPGWDGL